MSSSEDKKSYNITQEEWEASFAPCVRKITPEEKAFSVEMNLVGVGYVGQTKEKLYWDTIKQVYVKSAIQQCSDKERYQSFNIDPYKYCYVNNFDPFQFNIIKYVSRHKLKNGKEDLIKAKDTLERYIKDHYDDIS